VASTSAGYILRLTVVLVSAGIGASARATPPSVPDPWAYWPRLALAEPLDPVHCRLTRRRVSVACDADESCRVDDRLLRTVGSDCSAGWIIRRTIPIEVDAKVEILSWPAGRHPGWAEGGACPGEAAKRPDQTRICFPDPSEARIRFRYSLSASFKRDASPFAWPVALAKHLLLGDSALGGSAGVCLVMPPGGRPQGGAVELRADSSFRFEQSLMLWSPRAPAGRGPAGEALPGQPSWEPSTGKPASWSWTGRASAAALRLKKSHFGFSGLAVELGARRRSGGTWSGLGRLSADWNWTEYLYTTLALEASSIGDLGASLELTAALPYLLLLPSFGLSVGVGQDFRPDPWTFVRLGGTLQFPIVGVSAGYDFGLAPLGGGRFDLRLVFGF